MLVQSYSVQSRSTDLFPLLQFFQELLFLSLPRLLLALDGLGLAKLLPLLSWVTVVGVRVTDHSNISFKNPLLSVGLFSIHLISSGFRVFCIDATSLIKT